jgi:hypothetical protein
VGERKGSLPTPPDWFQRASARRVIRMFLLHCQGHATAVAYCAECALKDQIECASWGSTRSGNPRGRRCRAPRPESLN